MGWIPGSGRSPGEGHGNPLQHSGLENPTDSGDWRATAHRVTKELNTTKHAYIHTTVYKTDQSDPAVCTPQRTIFNIF